ncbi:concanavalin A-like lectin/glucanase, partial [Aureobasidium melanogenum]
MPFKSTFSAFKSQLKDLHQEGQRLFNEHSQKQQQPPPQNQPQHSQSYYPGQGAYQPQNFYPGQQPQPYYQGGQQYQQQGPPPVPQSTRPTVPGQPPSSPAVYWQPRFDPSTPVSVEWEHKLGNNNGWGNNEKQHYTADNANSFYTPNHLLVLRAISQPANPDPSKKYTSARLVSRQRLARPRGSLIATLTLPCASGIWPAFWLLPFEPFTWPTDGEVDIAETWNGDGVNHSCLHWGFYTPQDKDKHRVVPTFVQGMQQGRPVRFEFAWQQDESTGQGRLLWWIDGRAVMKAPIPQGTRRVADFVVLLNIAMGGNVCQGQEPREGTYDLVVHEMKMQEEPEMGGWARFDGDWSWVREGDTM